MCVLLDAAGSANRAIEHTRKELCGTRRSISRQKIESTLDRGFLDATSLAEFLVTKGVPFRTAHHIVGTLVARCEKEGKHALKQLSVDAFNEVIAASTIHNPQSK
ncbi:MAG TPA: hypothetical protein VHS31_06805 [Tepidisphaeraceae bacterium]|nr:hypothetical protein [Tepidisphaeraceae bacterium]